MENGREWSIVPKSNWTDFPTTPYSFVWHFSEQILLAAPPGIWLWLFNGPGPAPATSGHTLWFLFRLGMDGQIRTTKLNVFLQSDCKKILCFLGVTWKSLFQRPKVPMSKWWYGEKQPKQSQFVFCCMFGIIFELIYSQNGIEFFSQSKAKWGNLQSWQTLGYPFCSHFIWYGNMQNLRILKKYLIGILVETSSKLNIELPLNKLLATLCNWCTTLAVY